MTKMKNGMFSVSKVVKINFLLVCETRSWSTVGSLLSLNIFSKQFWPTVTILSTIYVSRHQLNGLKVILWLEVEDTHNFVAAKHCNGPIIAKTLIHLVSASSSIFN